MVNETRISVDNVIVSPITETEVLEMTNLNGKEAMYTLHIPKEDNNDWENTYVEFFGSRWRTIGKPIQYIEEMVPLYWNKKVRVESVG